jgi:transcriptional regulator with XRE-family HTH domain
MKKTPYGIFLKKLRIDRNEILEDMSKKMNITKSYLSAIECGKRNIPDYLNELILELYQLSDVEKLNMYKSYSDTIDNRKIKLIDIIQTINKSLLEIDAASKKKNKKNDFDTGSKDALIKLELKLRKGVFHE